jgi:hypothetical protein
MSSITPEFLKQRAREISYALNRVSFYIKREDLRNRLERLSFEFLENVAVGSEDSSDKQSLLKIFKNISALDVLIRIGHSLYEIEPVNATILIREIDSFNSAIRQFAEANSATNKFNSANPFAGEELNLESIFSMPPAVIENEAASIDKEKEIVERAYSSVGKNEFGNSSAKASTELSRMSSLQANSAIAEQVRQTDSSVLVRQELITDKIRQLGRANLKELSARFPGVSERTLRYDLQKLCDQGMIEKIGNSGPGTSYILKSNSAIK